MKTNIKLTIQNIFILLSSFLLLVGCTTDSTETFSDEQQLTINSSKRMTFSSFKEFNNKIDELSSYDNEGLKAWAEKNNSKSLLSKLEESDLENTYLVSLPEAYKAILNDNSEFAINDKILWLHKGDLFEFKNGDAIDLLKNKVQSLKPVGSITVSTNDLSNKQYQSKIVTMGANSLDGRFQREFRGNQYRDCNNNYKSINAQLKYVHELVTVQTVYNRVAASSKLYLRIKLEYKKRRRGWRPAGEPRNFRINMNLSIVQLRFSNGNNISLSGSNSINKSFVCSGDQTILLKSSDSYGVGGGSPSWTIQTSGTITHELNGGYNPWTNYAYW